MPSPTNPYQDFKTWLCDGNMKSELDPEVVKAVYIVWALTLFSRFYDTSIYLNDMYNNLDIYMKELSEKKIEFFKELKMIATRKRLSPWDLSYISLKKEKFDYKHLQETFPELKTYEIELLVDIMKEQGNKAFMEMVTEKKPTKRKLSKADEKLFK
jgi:hypothetical protein